MSLLSLTTSVNRLQNVNAHDTSIVRMMPLKNLDGLPGGVASGGRRTWSRRSCKPSEVTIISKVITLNIGKWINLRCHQIMAVMNFKVMIRTEILKTVRSRNFISFSQLLQSEANEKIILADSLCQSLAPEASSNRHKIFKLGLSSYIWCRDQVFSDTCHFWNRYLCHHHAHD